MNQCSSGARSNFATLVELLRTRAKISPDAVAYRYLVDGETEGASVTHAELDRQARAIAAKLQQSGRDRGRVVLLYPPDLFYVAAFFGCLYAGAIAVPAYPPDPGRLNRTLPRLQSIIADADADVVLTTSELLAAAQLVFAMAPELEAKEWIATDALESGIENAWRDPQITKDQVAFLQYTSGSTAAPKGVILTHENLLANLRLIAEAFQIDDASIGVSWLPPYHDMGLIGGILAPLHSGRPTALMSPVAFLQSPLRWLKAISHLGATISGGPNFAYELCVRKIDPAECRDLDLSTWRVAFSGAEPVRPETLDRFTAAFGPIGFRKSAFYPCYGLAEATLIVSGGPAGREPLIENLQAAALEHGRAWQAEQHDSRPRSIVSCGTTRGEQRIVIADPHANVECAAGEIGEIWVTGASVAKGYWRREEDTQRVFGAQLEPSEGSRFLRTGDLGYLRGGELFITGRLKDLVIIRGRNHYPQDIERTAEESHPSLRRGCCAAFAVEQRDEERLVVVVEVERRYRDRRRVSSPPSGGDRRGADRRQTDVDNVEHVADAAPALGTEARSPFDPGSVVGAIREAVLEHHDLHVHEVILVQPGAIPKTSSGKIQRFECRAAYAEGTLEPVANSVIRTVEESTTSTIGPAEIVTAIKSLSPSERVRWMENYLVEQVARTLHCRASQIDRDKPVSRFGLDSLMAVQLAHRLEKMLAVVLSPTDFLRDVTIVDVAERICEMLPVDGAEPVAASSGETVKSEAVLSPAQAALWCLQQLAPEPGLTIMSCAFRITSHVDATVLEDALQVLVDRHKTLRATYVLHDGVPVQRIRTGVGFELEHVQGIDEATLQTAIPAVANRPFNLTRGPLMRAALFTREPSDHVLVLAVHALAADNWSIVMLLNELKEAYLAVKSSRKPALTAPAMTYSRYTRAQAALETSQEGERYGRYWAQKLAGPLPALELPIDHPRPAVRRFGGGVQSFWIDASMTARLKDIARAESTTLYVVLLTAFETLLATYGHQEDVLIGTAVSCRNRAGYDRTIGNFMNNVVIRADLSAIKTFRDAIRAARENVLEAMRHQEYPFGLVLKRLRVERSADRAPLTQVHFALEKSYRQKDRDLSLIALGVPGAKARLGPLAVESYALPKSPAPVDLALTFIETSDQLYATLQYDPDLFLPKTAALIAEDLVTVLANVAERPDAAWRSVPSRVSQRAGTPARVGTAAAGAVAIGRNVAAPSERVAALERVLSATWSEVLGLEHVERTDDFFALGGDSIGALRLALRVASMLEMDLPPTSIFEHPTVASLADWLSHGPNGEAVLELAQLMVKVGDLSEDETGRLLAEVVSGRRA